MKGAENIYCNPDSSGIQSNLTVEEAVNPCQACNDKTCVTLVEDTNKF